MTEAADTSGQTAQFEFETSEREIRFVLDESVYAIDAVYGAAYLFIDRCFVFLTREGDGQVGVRLRTRGSATEAQLEELAGELANELLSQVLRHRIAVSTARIREYYMARAFHGGSGATTLDALLAELDDEELAEDSLEVDAPWEKADAS